MKLSGRESTLYRARAARGTHMAVDKADVQYAIKEACGGMASPTRGDLRRLTRIARYRVDWPRRVLNYPYQDTCLDVKGH